MKNISFTWKNIEPTDALKTLVESKFDRIQKHFDHITSVHVTFSVQKLENNAEITIHVPGQDLHAKGTAEDMYKAIDEMLHSLDRQLVKHKEKIKNHHMPRENREAAE